MRKHGITVKAISIILMSVIVFLTIHVDANAETHNGSNIVSNNIHDHDYTTNANVANSYMTVNGDGTISRVENMGDVILIETYDANFNVIGQGTVGFELSKFGGFYSGSNYNYFLFGQDNTDQNDGSEVIRIVRYTKNWVRAGHASVVKCNTRVPFAGSNTAFTEYGNCLFIRCGHMTYKDKNGNIPQASMTICYRWDNNSVIDIQSSVKGANYGTTANSGSQFLDSTNGTLTSVEESLTSPFAVLVTKYSKPIGQGTLQSLTSCASALGSVGALTSSIPSFSIGGYAVTPQYYMVVGNSMPMDGTSPNNNIFVAAFPINHFASQYAKISYLTGYAQGSVMTASTPYLVKINSNMYAILWEEKEGYSDTLKTKYVFIDGAGNRLSDTKQINGCLSDCQPICYGSNIVWYTTNGSNVKIYTIPFTNGAATNTVNTTGVNPYSTGNAIYNGVDYSSVYDYGYYISKYPDMRVLYGNNPQGALAHFVNTGMLEGRQASPNFEVNTYINNYPDLWPLYGNDKRSYYLHFVLYGAASGRNGITKIR